MCHLTVDDPMKQRHPRKPDPKYGTVVTGAAIVSACSILHCVCLYMPAPAAPVLQAVIDFLILVVCGAWGALGISVGQMMLLAPDSLPAMPLQVVIDISVPGLGAYIGFAAVQQGFRMGQRLEHLQQHLIPILALAATCSATLLHFAGSSTSTGTTNTLVLFQAATLNFAAIMFAMVTMSITIRTLRRASTFQ
jgi:hypothetical protein